MSNKIGRRPKEKSADQGALLFLGPLSITSDAVDFLPATIALDHHRIMIVPRLVPTLELAFRDSVLEPDALVGAIPRFVLFF